MCLAVFLSNAELHSDITRHPASLNVNTQGATTMFLSYGNLKNQVAGEALWCSRLVPAAPDLGMKCDPATTWGRLPIRYDRTTPSGTNGYTDIMTIPQNVARRAYQSAAGGENSAFFYVRQFISTNGGPDEFVFITCRLAGGGARVPLALVDVKLQFATEKSVLATPVGQAPPAFHAEISYTGSGRLIGRWEVVLPGDEPPAVQDLLTEASVPIEQRARQKRYAAIQRFDEFLPPSGRHRLQGPDPSKLPVAIEGLYLVLFRVEASNDPDGNSDLALAGSGTGVVNAGGVAGFPMPVLRYFVGSANPSLEAASNQSIQLFFPASGATALRSQPLDFSWSERPSIALYRLEIRDANDTEVLTAVLKPGVGKYRAPAWLPERVAAGKMSWRVVGLDDEGRVADTSSWQAIQYAEAPAAR